MDFFSDRRDCSERGLKRRERFGNLMSKLETRGMQIDQVRKELLKLLRGEHSEVLESLRLRQKS